ncbi:Nudix hydrolase 9 [Vitis vinifera]|uniref:Nudix hydrolase 9 n=1 Tax=Vitis vinifera TaxID=29760 RepID=A0A438G1G9_VITVI|nr:Nudix hydrolase 9 [Vitis vinifera]
MGMGWAWVENLGTFVGTNLNPLWEKFLVPSEDDSVRCQHTSSPLGNGAIIETSDKRIVVLRRSNNVGEFPGHFVFPGGHPEPQEIGIVSHQFDKDMDPDFINRKVSQEMFDSIVREVVEEIGVPEASLCNPVLIGVSCRVLNVRPAAFFFIKCNLHSKEIQQLYSTAQDGYESTHLYTVSRVGSSCCATECGWQSWCSSHEGVGSDGGVRLMAAMVNDLKDMTSKMPGCHQGGFALYMLMVEAVKDV